MAYYPPDEDTVHFVGGDGINPPVSKSEFNGGGCTQVVWDASGDILDFMTTAGGPITSTVNATYDHTGGAAEHIVLSAGIGTGVKVGTLAYLSGTNITTGVYEITSIAGDDSWVAFADIDATGDNADTTINVGGALDELQNALDNPSTSAYAGPPPLVKHNRIIYTNLPEDLVAAIDVDTGGGSVQYNSKKRIIGFKFTPGDLDEGGALYQGPLDAYVNGINAGKCITYDAQDNNINVFAIDGQDNVEFYNLHLRNTDEAANGNGVEFFTGPVGIKFINCKLSDVYIGIKGIADTLLVQDCYHHSSRQLLALLTGSHNSIVLGCVIKPKAAYNCLVVRGECLVIGNIFIDGLRGIVLLGQATVCHNVFYNQTIKCIRVIATGATLIEYNNIFMPAAVADYAVHIDGNLGAVLYSDYSCAWSVAGSALNNAWYDQTNTMSFKGSNSIEANPMLMDPANKDFRLQDNSPCLYTGKATLGGP